MKRNLVLLFAAFFTISLSYGQKNKYGDVMNSKKLGVSYKSVKAKDKEEYYQQYYWLKRMEELKSYPHLSGIKPKVLYSFIKEISQPIPTKTLTKEQKKFREDAELSLDQYFKNKQWDNPVMKLNLNTYVDPEKKKYFDVIRPEKINVLLPKRLYAFTAENAQTQTQKIYYLWINEDEYKIVDIVPNKKDNEIFYEELKRDMPSFNFPDFVPEAVTQGDKKVKSDIEYIYITPFQINDNNIVYKTKDFKEFIFVRYKKDGGPWTDVEHRKRKW